MKKNTLYILCMANLASPLPIPYTTKIGMVLVVGFRKYILCMVNFGSHSKFEKSAKDDFSGEQIHEQGRHTFYAILIKGAAIMFTWYCLCVNVTMITFT